MVSTHQLATSEADAAAGDERAARDSRADARCAAVQLGLRCLQGVQQAALADALARQRQADRGRHHHRRSRQHVHQTDAHAGNRRRRQTDRHESTL